MWQTLVGRGLVVMAVLVSTSCGSTSAPTKPRPTASSTAVDVQREVMGTADPPNARGESLSMTRVTFPPGYRIPTHTHPGTQLAFVERGTLTYEVVRGGSVTIHRSDGTTQRLGPGDRTKIPAGSWLVELPGVVHYGWNQTSAEVVVLTSALLGKGKPVSTEVK